MTEAKQGHYSQRDEQNIITSYFQEKGRFLDIGAYDGVTFSNVYQLVLDGWTGISVEPSPLCFTKLMENYKGKEIILLNALIGSGGIERFYDSNGDAIGTTVKEHKEVWDNHTEFQEFYIPSITIETLTKSFPQFYKSFDFINIDTEGTSIEIFREVIKKVSFRMVCVEHDGKNEFIEEIQNTGMAHALRTLLVNEENIILAE